MGLSATYRWILVGKLSIKNGTQTSGNEPDFNIDDVIKALAARITRGNTYVNRVYLKETKLMWCTDLDTQSDFHRLILQFADKNVSGASYHNFNTGKTRDIKKEENEGGHYGAHILIKTTADEHGRYLILIESVPGISMASVKEHLAWACNNHNYYQGVEIEIVGHQSKTIREALETGTLQDIEFIRKEEKYIDGIDEDGITQTVTSKLQIKIKKDPDESKLANFINNLGGHPFCKEEPNSKALIKIKTPNGQIKRTEVELDKDEILEQAFMQREIVNGFDKPLPQRYEKFHDAMLEKMIEVAKAVDG